MILKINKYLLTLIASYGVLSSVSLNAEPAVAEETTKSIRDSIGREIVSEQTVEAEANRYMKKANDAFIKNSYKDAVENYLEAINILKKVGDGENGFFKSKIDNCKEQISKSYQYWAMDLSFEAEKKSHVKDFDKAIELCKLAIEIYPACKKEMEIKISAFEKLRNASARRKETEPSKIVPGKDEQEYSIQVSLKQALVLIEAGKLEEAKTKYEQILLLDPYQADAIQGLRAVNIRIGKISDQRYFNTHKERIAELEWKWATPIIPETADDASHKSGEPIRKENIENKIQQKLNGIIIPRIDFEDVTIPTAIKYLREQSKQLDPEGVGVNIFLRLKPLEGTEKKAEAAKPAEGGEGGGGDVTAEGGGEDKKFSVVNLILTKPTSLGEAIRFLCQAAKLKFRVEKYAVVIASEDVPLDDLETKIFPVEQGSLAAVGGGEDPEALKKHFEERGIKFPDGAKVVYDARISRLIVTNTVENIRKVELVIENELNSKDPMVQVQAKFIEVEQNDLKELSFDYYLSRPLDNVNTANGQLQFDRNDPTLRNLQTAGAPDELFVYHRETNGYNFDFMVYALDQVDTQDILSSPKITTMNGQEASIRMVREIYLPTDWSEAKFTTTSNTGSTGSASTVSTYVSGVPQFSDATELGIMLKVTPEVDLPSRTVTMRMNPTVQALVGWTVYTYTLTGTGVPPGATESIMRAVIAIRTLDTKITLYDGETIVLGGIIKDNSQQIDDKIPILGDIPLLGRFFQSQSTRSEKTNLLIFLTCRLVKPDGSPFFPEETAIRGIPEFKNLQ